MSSWELGRANTNRSKCLICKRAPATGELRWVFPDSLGFECLGCGARHFPDEALAALEMPTLALSESEGLEVARCRGIAKAAQKVRRAQAQRSARLFRNQTENPCASCGRQMLVNAPVVEICDNGASEIESSVRTVHVRCFSGKLPVTYVLGEFLRADPELDRELYRAAWIEGAGYPTLPMIDEEAVNSRIDKFYNLARRNAALHDDVEFWKACGKFSEAEVWQLQTEFQYTFWRRE